MIWYVLIPTESEIYRIWCQLLKSVFPEAEISYDKIAEDEISFAEDAHQLDIFCINQQYYHCILLWCNVTIISQKHSSLLLWTLLNVLHIFITILHLILWAVSLNDIMTSFLTTCIFKCYFVSFCILIITQPAYLNVMWSSSSSTSVLLQDTHGSIIVDMSSQI